MMIPLETIWGYLEVGAAIIDADGTPWRVQARRTDLPRIALFIDNGHAQHWVVKLHDDPVVLLDESQAVDFVFAEMPGSRLEVDTLPTSDSPSTIAIYKAHLLHQHNTAAGHSEKSLKSLIELHAIEHSRAEPRGIPHVHVRQN